MSGIDRNKVYLADRAEASLLYPPPRDTVFGLQPVLGGALAYARFYDDDRKDTHRLANLYYLYLTTGDDSTFTVSTMITGRLFRSYVKFNGSLMFDQHRNKFNWASIERNGASDHRHGNETLAQWLAGSGEIQYCAAAVGLPYDVVGLVELLILAIV